MANPYEPLVPARIAFDAWGTPFSALYNDVYHTGSGALGQAEHVFLQGNQLPVRWRDRSLFTVCETGFGLGRNFLALWQAWRSDPSRPRRLHMVSFEAHPFERADLARLVAQGLPGSLTGLAGQLVDAWPPLLPGLHRLEFESGALTLTLAFGPVKKLAKQISARVDAYFLDGFAPAKNPEMWTPALFGQLVRMANAGATAASWCCAVSVRRALAEAGFLVSKAPGFGRKREMTVAVLRPTLGCRDAAAVPPAVLVVGGGLAGAGIAHCLALRGQAVTIIDPVFDRGLGASHKGHKAAALTPLIARDDNLRARLTRAGTARALQRWQSLPPGSRPAHCGTIELALNESDALELRSTLDHLSFPSAWVSWLDRREVSARVGFPVAHGGVFFADGQLVQPEPFLEALLAVPGIDCVAGHVARVERLSGGEWQALDMSGRRIAGAPVAVLANAAQAKTILSRMPSPPASPRVGAMHELAGQVSYFSPSEPGFDPKLILGGEGYWLPSVNHVSVAGSTYVPGAQKPEVTAQGHRAIIDKVTELLGATPSQINGWLDPAEGWAGWRAVTAGRLPVIGPMAQAPGLWLACAYGSRGLTWSALAGDIIAAQLNQEPLPLERELLRAIAP
jgi:tRNA 5-methylaminomethyl-2-thiouridine biosynthesis bifunctional protein